MSDLAVMNCFQDSLAEKTKKVPADLGKGGSVMRKEGRKGRVPVDSRSTKRVVLIIRS